MSGNLILQVVTNFGDQKLIHPNFDTAFWVLILLNLVFIAVAKTKNPGYFKALFTTAILNRQLLQATQEDLKITSTSSVLLTFTYFNVLAIVVGFLSFGNFGSASILFLGILVMLAIIKWATISFIAYVSQTKNGILEHTYNHFIFYQIGGLIMTPFLLFTHFIPAEFQAITTTICLILVMLLLFIREIQSLQRALKARVSVLYIILYLCTLEILPLVLFYYGFVSKLEGFN